jgi:hypothetical protein
MAPGEATDSGLPAPIMPQFEEQPPHDADPGRGLPQRDDALMRAAADIAAPARRLLAGLRDAHAEAGARVAMLQDLIARPDLHGRPTRFAVARLLGEAEEQFRRIEIVFSHLRARPSPGATHSVPLPAAPPRDAVMLRLLEAEERRGAQDALALRGLAQLCGQHLAARLLDLTAEERGAAARDLAELASTEAARARHH